GDIITQVDGEAVETFRELRLVLDRYSPGDEVAVTTWRDGETETQGVVLR
ncbi:MAG TPA: peptidase S1, partial [Acidobacteria bacterium]|nr:peptidase S1 [Acidobacteriota bacterium]